MSRFSLSMAKNPLFIYSTALPLTLLSNRVSQQFGTLSMVDIRLKTSSIGSDVKEGQPKSKADLCSFQSDNNFSSAMFSADLHYIVSQSSLNGSIDIWNAHTGEKIRN